MNRVDMLLVTFMPSHIILKYLIISHCVFETFDPYQCTTTYLFVFEKCLSPVLE